MIGLIKMRIVKIGLIGCGTVTIKAHIPALMNDPTAKLSGHLFQITAICGLDRDNLDYIKSILPWVKVYQSYEEMLNKADCEAVLIATGENLHPQISSLALKLGKYVLCEKPMGIGVKEIKAAFANVTEDQKYRLQIAFNKRYYPSYLQYNELLVQKKIGRPVCGLFYFFTQQGRKQGWGGLLSNLIHYCDLINAIFGKVSALSAYSHKGQTGTSITVTLRNEDGAVISFLFTSAASWNAALHEEWQLVDDNRRRFVARNCDEVLFFNSDSYYKGSSNSIFWSPDPYGYKTQLKSFYELVCGMRKKPEVALDNALFAHELFEQIKRICE